MHRLRAQLEPAHPSGSGTSWCVVSTTMPPRSSCSPISVDSAATPRTSSAVNGSSRIHSLASRARNSRASAIRRRWPCDRARACEVSKPDRPTETRAWRATSSPAGCPAMAAAKRTFSSAVSSSFTPFRWPTVGQRLPVVLAQLADVGPAPAHLAVRGRQQPAQDAQQAGLAGAVLAGHVQAMARLDAERQPGEEAGVRRGCIRGRRFRAFGVEGRRQAGGRRAAGLPVGAQG